MIKKIVENGQGMIYPALKSLYSTDVHDLENYVPEYPECFGFSLRAMFGPADSEGEESFDVMVCPPAWLALQMKDDEVRSIRHYLMVKNYNFGALKAFIVKYGSKCSGETWHDAAEKLSLLGHWEFEDYVPYVAKK